MKTLLIFLLLTTSAMAQTFPSDADFSLRVEYPPIRNFHAYAGAMKGAVPGYAKKPVYFDSRLAEDHLRHLYNDMGVRLVVSLDHCKNMAKLIEEINEEFPGVDLRHMCRRVGRHKKYYKRNITLFKEIARLIGGETFYIHCRHGAHRAVTTLTGAWIAKDKLTFKEAFERAGGNIKHFRSKFHHELLGQARRYAKEQQKSE